MTQLSAQPPPLGTQVALQHTAEGGSLVYGTNTFIFPSMSTVTRTNAVWPAMVSHTPSRIFPFFPLLMPRVSSLSTVLSPSPNSLLNKRS